MHSKLKLTWKRVSRQLNMEFAAGVANVRFTLKRDSKEIYRVVAQCKAVVGTQLSVLQSVAQTTFASGAVGSALSDTVDIPEVLKNSGVGDAFLARSAVDDTEPQGPDEQ